MTKVSKLEPTKENVSVRREKALRTRLILFLIVTTILFISTKNNPVKTTDNGEINKQQSTLINNNPPAQNTTVETTQTKVTTNMEEPTAYKIMFTETNIREDKGNSYYLLIDPVIDTTNDWVGDFKPLIKQIIYEITQQYGGNISILFFDDIGTLHMQHEWDTVGLDRLVTKEERENRILHFIANFDGELETNPYFNELVFFLGASPDNALVGKYVEDIEYNPTAQTFN
jgi:hypothetical protein